MIDETLTYGYTNAKELENQAKDFWKVIARGDPVAIGNSFLSILGFLCTQKIKVREDDLTYFKEVVLGHYLKPKFDKIPVPSEVELSKDSDYERIPDHTDILLKVEEKLHELPTKKSHKPVADEEEFDHYYYRLRPTKNLKEKLQKGLEEEQTLALLEHHISEIYNQHQVKMQDYKSLNQVLNKIQTLLLEDERLCKKYGTPIVENFGSSANSLWSLDSDIDIVIQFVKEEKADKNNNNKKEGKKNNKNNQKETSTQKKVKQFKKLDYIKALKDVRSVIRNIAEKGNIEGVFSAKVPILKFKDYRSQIECDISINNSAGIPNSKLTRLYCEFDQRAHIMIKYLRYLFKNAGLLYGDQGCLSSYSIILMVIAFLQSQKEPVLPNLQDQVKPSDLEFFSVTKNKYGKVNCTEVKSNIYENLKELKKTFQSKNTKSVAQLVLEFLDFYFLDPKLAECAHK